MMIKVLHYDSFTDTPGMGNPAGIVINADNLSEKQMQSVAAAAGYNETAFVLFSGKADMHGRHFSSPFSGTVEDPVTGTASGVMGAYYQKHMLKSDNSRKRIVIEQGQDIGKDGIIKVELPIKEEDAVKIYGTAVFVKEFFVKEW